MSPKFAPRSAYDLTGGIVYFGRMLDKIRLHAADRLREDFHANLGVSFDGRCSRFLGVILISFQDEMYYAFFSGWHENPPSI
jgi:hypothetical protein